MKPNMMRIETHEPSPPVSFRERLQSLAGGTTWREPMLGGGGGAGNLPAAHALAAALGMARAGKDDVGPDVAIDVVFGTTTHAPKVGRAVADAMAKDRARACRRCRPWLRIVCWAAYAELVHGYALPQLRPSEMSASDWNLLTRAASAIMEALAEDAVQRARRAWVGERRAG